jgi:hypothetical protein
MTRNGEKLPKKFLLHKISNYDLFPIMRPAQKRESSYLALEKKSRDIPAVQLWLIGPWGARNNHTNKPTRPPTNVRGRSFSDCPYPLTFIRDKKNKKQISGPCLSKRCILVKIIHPLSKLLRIIIMSNLCIGCSTHEVIECFARMPKPNCQSYKKQISSNKNLSKILWSHISACTNEFIDRIFRYNQTCANFHLQITTTCQQQPP